MRLHKKENALFACIGLMRKRQCRLLPRLHTGTYTPGYYLFVFFTLQIGKMEAPWLFGRKILLPTSTFTNRWTEIMFVTLMIRFSLLSPHAVLFRSTINSHSKRTLANTSIHEDQDAVLLILGENGMQGINPCIWHNIKFCIYIWPHIVLIFSNQRANISGLYVVI